MPAWGPEGRRALDLGDREACELLARTPCARPRHLVFSREGRLDRGSGLFSLGPIRPAHSGAAATGHRHGPSA